MRTATLISSPGWICAIAGILWLGLPHATSAYQLSPAEAQGIGQRIWQNECNGSVAGLTSWNPGENFASLGIGHFIWYPSGKKGPFEESLPEFAKFAANHQATVPELLRSRACPWNSRLEFEAARASAPMKQLRAFLVDTIPLQAQFLVARLEQARAKMLNSATPEQALVVQRQLARMGSTAQGCYALVDYVNFKGEGTLATERYQDQGWGLLQVLLGMRPDSASAVDDFADSAKAVLEKRVQNAPPSRREARWLAGWLNRVNTYRHRK